MQPTVSKVARPLVSVIMPAFNASPWIADAVKSVLSQTWDNLEVLVVDDGSTDDTVARGSDTRDRRLRIFRQDNSGAAAARNRGLRESAGDFIQYLDADDLLSPDKIASQVIALQDAPQASIASCAWRAFSKSILTADGVHEPVWRETDPVSWLIRSLRGEGMMQPSGWLIPRVVIERTGSWNETLSLHDDAEYFTRVLVNSAHNVFVDGPTAYYRSTPGSLSRRRGRAAAESSLRVSQLRQDTILGVRDNHSARTALATAYAQFAYEFVNAHPDLVEQALTPMEGLGAKPDNVVGGPAFKAVARLAGFRNALKLRSIVGGRRHLAASNFF